MITVTQIVLLVMACLSFLAFAGSKTEQRGYMFLLGSVVTFILLLISFCILL